MEGNGMRFYYYENGYKEVFYMKKLYRQFTQAKKDGILCKEDTFKSWLQDNIKMQILIPAEQITEGKE